MFLLAVIFLELEAGKPHIILLLSLCDKTRNSEDWMLKRLISRQAVQTCAYYFYGQVSSFFFISCLKKLIILEKKHQRESSDRQDRPQKENVMVINLNRKMKLNL